MPISDQIVNTRDRAYLDILAFGLNRLRDAALAGRVDYCAIESEHLHNIPSLIGEQNEERHRYYLQQERPLYLGRVDKTIPGVDFILARYAELWSILEKECSEG